VHRQSFARELVDDIEQLDLPAPEGLVELEADRPRVMGPLLAQPSRRIPSACQGCFYEVKGTLTSRLNRSREM
jgi:hypothetical protein